jgi:transcriptional regulator with XRE-family HTH domain
MTANGKGMPKYARVAEDVRAQIADGTLRPGQPAPSGAALSRVTGFSTLTCRKALRMLIADGALIPGPSRNARPRVAGPPQPPVERDLAAAARALAAGLAGRRRAKGLTQPELARRVGVSVTTVGHAETGRLWQSRQFWERADAILGAGGALLRLHDAYRAAAATGTADNRQGAAAAVVVSRAAAAGHARPAGPYWPPLPGARAVPPRGELAGGQVPEPRERWDGEATAEINGPYGQEHAPAYPPAAGGQAMPACVMIMWSDGTVTTVHPPAAPPAGQARNEAP